MLKLLTEAITEESTGYYSGVNRLLLMRKQTLVQADAIQCSTEDQKLSKKIWIHTSRHIIINRNGKEGTGKFQMGRSHWVTDVCYYRREL